VRIPAGGRRSIASISAAAVMMVVFPTFSMPPKFDFSMQIVRYTS
jgi:hypothetical protein